MGPKYITRASLLCSAAKASGHRRAVKVLQFTVFANRGPPLSPENVQAMELWKNKLSTPLPSSHLHNTFKKSKRVGFVHSTSLCTSPVLRGAITRPVPLCFIEHNSGLVRALEEFIFPVFRLSFDRGIHLRSDWCSSDSRKPAEPAHMSGEVGGAGGLWALTVQLRGRLLPQLCPVQMQALTAVLGLLEWMLVPLPADFCWRLSPDKPNQCYCATICTF